MAKLKDRYANALLELSEESGTLEKVLEQAVFVRDILDSPDVKAFLVHPHIPDSAKHQLFRNAFSGELISHLKGFLYLMVRKNRESLIVTVLAEFIYLANKRLGRIEAKVVSAKALTEERIESIRIKLSRKTGMKVEVKATVDPDVLGGFYVLMDGHIFDGTVRSELNSIRERLKRGSY